MIISEVKYNTGNKHYNTHPAPNWFGLKKGNSRRTQNQGACLEKE